MKRGQFSQEQIVAILHQAERGEQTIQAICREHGIAETTFYRWRKKFGGMTTSEAQRLRELEKENGRLKRLLAERDLEVDALKELLAKKASASSSAVRRCSSWRSMVCPCSVLACLSSSIARPFCIRRGPSLMMECLRRWRRLLKLILATATGASGQSSGAAVASTGNGSTASGSRRDCR